MIDLDSAFSTVSSACWLVEWGVFVGSAGGSLDEDRLMMSVCGFRALMSNNDLYLSLKLNVLSINSL